MDLAELLVGRGSKRRARWRHEDPARRSPQDLLRLKVAFSGTGVIRLAGWESDRHVDSDH